VTETRFKLHYNLKNNGDGSASVKLHPTAQAAEDQDEKDVENGCDGWGENSAGQIELKVVDGLVYYRCREWDGINLKERWLPAERD